MLQLSVSGLLSELNNVSGFVFGVAFAPFTLDSPPCSDRGRRSGKNAQYWAGWHAANRTGTLPEYMARYGHPPKK